MKINNFLLDKMKKELCNNAGLGQRVHAFFLTSMREITKPNKFIEEIKMKKRFKPINGYEGLYEISNLGKVKSLAKKWVTGNGGVCKKETTELKIWVNHRGYPCVVLHKEGEQKNIKIHHLVYDHFGEGERNGITVQIDHIDNNKLNPRIGNLQLFTQRKNTTKYWKNRKTSSKYTGVCWHKREEKWRAAININGKKKYLGRFINEYDAHLAYQKALANAKLKPKE